MTYYIAIVSFLFLLLLYVLKRLKRLEDYFRENVEENKSFGAMRNKHGSLKNIFKRSREKAIKNLGMRFTIIRRIIFILWLSVLIFLILFPFMENFSKGVFSIFASAGTLLLGFAAKPFIENIIAGIVITLSKQFNIGDTIIIKENYGVVEDINMTHTIVKLWDWQRLVIPNQNMIRENFINYTIVNESQWSKVEFWISYEADIELVKKTALSIARESQYREANTEPEFWIMDMTPENVKCWVAALTDSPANGWFFRSDFRTKLYIELKKLNIKPHFKYYILNRGDKNQV